MAFEGEGHALRTTSVSSDPEMFSFGKLFGEVGKYLGKDLAPSSLWTDDAGDRDKFRVRGQIRIALK
jgi:hypothetical protein